MLHVLRVMKVVSLLLLCEYLMRINYLYRLKILGRGFRAQLYSLLLLLRRYIIRIFLKYDLMGIVYCSVTCN